ncbi:hypothetical protein PRZ48_001402 [Zasmidium cellare]|uniref:Uncharacterized protein n=1 Tax=Zasmidium cellare TaxID=395010 RepID=A0ABR0F1U7_ZASCE|nr:hypothetical protein PRZ48_001402 [Zasmidium cellare]
MARREQDLVTLPGEEHNKFKYPEYLNVYRAGSNKTAFMGIFRVVATVCFPLGCLYATAFFFSPDHSNWWIIPIVVGSAVPMVTMMLATGPYVHAIEVRLPPSVRMSREALIRFADNTPGKTEARLACMRLLPWPTNRDVKFGLLRKYRPSFKRGYSNLEYVPEHTGEAEKYEGTWWHNMAMNFFGRFMVDNVVRDRSSAPGVWIKMWKQIPELGSENDPVKKMNEGKKAVVMANRPQRATNAPQRPSMRPDRPQR